MTSVAAHAGQDLWPAVGTLLRLRLSIMLRGFRRSTGRRKVGTIILVIVVVGLLVGLFLASSAILRLMRSPELTQVAGDFGPLIQSIPTLLLGGAFLGILLTSFGVLLQALYLAGDMDFLLSAPIPLRAVFVSKLLQAILPNLGVIALFGLPLLFGLGAADRFSWIYYPMVVLVLVALALAAAGASSMLVMAIVRIVPARRVAEVLGFLGAITSILCSQSGQLANLNRVSGDQAAGMLRLVSRLDVPWSPLSWAGRGLLGIGRGEWLQGIAYLALVLGLSGGVFYIALGAAERLYYSGWARVQAGRRRKAGPRAAAVASTREGLPSRLLSRPVRAIVVKDFLVLRRDLRNMSQLVTPLIFGVIYAIMLVRGGGVPPAGKGEAPEWFMTSLRTALGYGNLAIALFIGWSLLTRLAGMGFSQEGKNYWLLKGAPIRPSQLLTAKFLVAYLPAAAMGWVFLLIISLLRDFDISQLGFDLAVVGLCIAGAAGINLAFGVTGAKMDWEDPRQMVRSSVGCLSTLVSLVFLPVCLGLFLGPAFVAAFLGFPVWIGRLAGLVLGGALGVAAAWIPPRLVRDRLPQLGET